MVRLTHPLAVVGDLMPQDISRVKSSLASQYLLGYDLKPLDKPLLM
jgi:hypothetical protein